MWSCSSPRKKTQRKNRRPAKQKTPRILPIWGRVLGVLFRYRSIWHKCVACIRRMQYTKGLGLSQQAFCNAKMAFVYTNALLAEVMASVKARIEGFVDFLLCWSDYVAIIYNIVDLFFDFEKNTVKTQIICLWS